jgi:hypothetical protein
MPSSGWEYDELEEYWYQFITEVCVYCRRTKKYKIRKYNEKPSDPENCFVVYESICPICFGK